MKQVLRIYATVVAVAGLSFAGASPAWCAGKPADMVPAAVRAMSVVTVPSQINYPPYEYYAEDNKTPIGIDAELLSAIGEVLNLKFEMVNASVASIIPSIQNGRYSMSISALFDRPSDQQQVDFVDYYKSYTILLAPKGNPLKIKEWSDLCGKRAMGTAGQPSLTLVEDESKRCVAVGKPPIDAQSAPGTSVRLQALKSGRTDATPTESAVGAYLARQPDSAYEVVTKPVDPHILGIVFKKGDKEFQDSVQAALRELKSSGRYKVILEKYGVASGALDDFTINGGN